MPKLKEFVPDDGVVLADPTVPPTTGQLLLKRLEARAAEVYPDDSRSRAEWTKEHMAMAYTDLHEQWLGAGQQRQELIATAHRMGLQQGA